MHKNIIIYLFVAISLNAFLKSPYVSADDPIDDEIKVAKELATNPTAVVEEAATTNQPDSKQKTTKFYMCLIYCQCGCIEVHCCSGCKMCSKEQLNDLLFSNMNASENQSLLDDSTTTIP